MHLLPIFLQVHGGILQQKNQVRIFGPVEVKFLAQFSVAAHKHLLDTICGCKRLSRTHVPAVFTHCLAKRDLRRKEFPIILTARISAGDIHAVVMITPDLGYRVWGRLDDYRQLHLVRIPDEQRSAAQDAVHAPALGALLPA